MNDIKNAIKNMKKDAVWTAIALIIIGTLFVMFPDKSSMIICYATGAALLVFGVIKIVNYIRMKPEELFGSYGLVAGVLLLIAGSVILARPGIIAGIITIVFSVILIGDGVLKIQYAIDLIRVNARGWWIVLIVGIAMSVFGVVAILNPFGTIATLMIFLGIILIIDGISDITTITYISKTAKEVKNAFTAQMPLDVEVTDTEDDE